MAALLLLLVLQPAAATDCAVQYSFVDADLHNTVIQWMVDRDATEAT